jgi:hypothetical protein
MKDMDRENKIHDDYEVEYDIPDFRAALDKSFPARRWWQF